MVRQNADKSGQGEREGFRVCGRPQRIVSRQQQQGGRHYKVLYKFSFLPSLLTSKTDWIVPTNHSQCDSDADYCSWHGDYHIFP